MKHILLFLSVMLFPAGTWAADFAGGTGGQANPYQIANRAQLENLRNYLGKNNRNIYFRITADINLSGADWVPIGDSEDNSFQGKLDGGGHTIHNLNIGTDGNTYSFTGLFGVLYLGEIRNLTISGGTIIGGGMYTGSFIGHAIRELTMENCMNEANVIAGESPESRTGGIIGNMEVQSNYYTKITACMNNGHVTGGGTSISATGGIVGYGSVREQSYLSIKQCVNTGDITGADMASSDTGGIIGLSTGSSSNLTIIVRINIYDCYNTGDIHSAGNAGGIVGRIQNTAGDSRQEVFYCHASGKITGTAKAGGIVGNRGSAGVSTLSNLIAAQTVIDGNSASCRIISNNNYTSNIYSTYANQDMLVNGSKLTSTTKNDSFDGNSFELKEFYKPGFYTIFIPKWDFATIWAIRSDATALPFFRWQAAPATVEKATTTQAIINLETASDSIRIYKSTTRKKEYLTTIISPGAGKSTYGLPSVNTEDVLMFVNYRTTSEQWAPSFPVIATVTETGTGIASTGQDNIVIGPNPATDYITLIGATGADITITDVYGRILDRRRDIKDVETIRISNLSNGVYLIVIQNKGERVTKKILKR